MQKVSCLTGFEFYVIEDWACGLYVLRFGVFHGCYLRTTVRIKNHGRSCVSLEGICVRLYLLVSLLFVCKTYAKVIYF